MSIDDIVGEIAKAIVTHGPGSTETQNILKGLVDTHGAEAVTAAGLIVAERFGTGAEAVLSSI